VLVKEENKIVDNEVKKRAAELAGIARFLWDRADALRREAQFMEEEAGRLLKKACELKGIKEGGD